MRDFAQIKKKLSFLSSMLCFKRTLKKKKKEEEEEEEEEEEGKISLNLCFMADFHRLQDHFSNFLLNVSSLPKNAKRETWRQKGDLRCKIYNCIKRLALLILIIRFPFYLVFFPSCLLFLFCMHIFQVREKPGSLSSVSLLVQEKMSHNWILEHLRF